MNIYVSRFFPLAFEKCNKTKWVYNKDCCWCH